MVFTDQLTLTKNTTAISLLALLLLLNVFLAGFSKMTVSTRITFALVRDEALPCSDYLHKLNERTKNPDRILALVLILDSLLCMLPLISTTAFVAITSITNIGYQFSYAIPIFLKLTSAKDTFKPTQYYNLGKYSQVIGWLALFWLMLTSLVLFFPLRLPITVETFNYTGPVFLTALLVAAIYWNFKAKFTFKGPHRGGNNIDEALLE